MNTVIKSKNKVNYFVSRELSNKFFINLKIAEKKNYLIRNNFKFSDVKFIKTIIAFEIFSRIRPKITAVLWKKSVIINIQGLLSVTVLSYLQKEPLPWSQYFYNSFNINKYFNQVTSFVVKNNKLTLTVNNKANKIDLIVKSAYLD